jgi:hypothetical protein
MYTYSELQNLRDNNKARIVDIDMDGTVQLWEVDGDNDRYVVLQDNSVITQQDDNSDGHSNAFFPCFGG